MSDDLVKVLPALGLATRAAGALKNTNMVANAKKLMEGAKKVKESPMGMALSSLKDAADRNKAQDAQMSSESRQLARGGGVGGSNAGY